MDRTDLAEDFLRRSGPGLGVAGGLAFFGYWYVRAHEIVLPHFVGTLLDVSTFLLLGTAALGYQVAQGLLPGAWVGWAGLTALLSGLLSSLPAACLGLVLLGICIARSGVHPRVPGVLMAASGFLLLLTAFYGAGFGRGHADIGLVGGALMGVALIGVAGSLADLALSRAASPQKQAARRQAA